MNLCQRVLGYGNEFKLVGDRLQTIFEAEIFTAPNKRKIYY
jgi:hypothetical protein